MAHDVAIFESPRFTFVGIAYQVLIALILLGHETPLQAGRKTGAAAPAQRRFLDFLNDFFRRNLFIQDFSQRGIAFALLIISEPPIVGIGWIHARSEYLRRLGHWLNSSSNWSILSLGHEAAHALVINQQYGCVAACPHAFPFLQRKFAVGGRFIETDTQFLLNLGYSIVCARQGAWKIRAHCDLVFTQWLKIVHIVERRHFIHRDRRHSKILGDEIHSFVRKPPFLILGDGERRHDRGLSLIRGIFGDFTINFLYGL